MDANDVPAILELVSQATKKVASGTEGRALTEIEQEALWVLAHLAIRLSGHLEMLHIKQVRRQPKG